MDLHRNTVNVLAVGAHCDDVELGCGATLAKHVAAGDHVSILHLSAGVGSREWPEEPSLAAVHARCVCARRAAVHLGAHRIDFADFPDQRFDVVPFLDIVKAIEEMPIPNVVYSHHQGDLNLDHAITARAVLTAFRPCAVGANIYAFEVLSSTEWGAGFEPTMFVGIDGDPWLRKLAALRDYADEIPEHSHPRSIAAVDALSRSRGASVGLQRAEAFVTVRQFA